MRRNARVEMAIKLWFACPEAPLECGVQTLLRATNLTQQGLSHYMSQLVRLGFISRKEGSSNNRRKEPRNSYQRGMEPTLAELNKVFSPKEPAPERDDGGVSTQQVEADKAAMLWAKGFEREGKTWRGVK